MPRTRKPKKVATIQVRGEVVSRKLDSVKPNPWNPNTMSEDMKESLLYGLKRDGWLASQALLVWGTDETGVRQDLIIDGEHRWIAATGEGLVKGPMVFLDGLTEVEAKALTIKMNQKRGEWNPEMLAGVVKELDLALETDDLALDLGLGDDFVMEMLSAPAIDLEGKDGTKPTAPEPGGTGMPSGSSHVKQVQLFFDAKQKQEWDELLAALGKAHGTSNASDTVLAGLRDAVKVQKAPPRRRKKAS